MKTVYFKTPTLLSHLDLFSMGGSDKSDDDALIGKYNSGLCYSMALALRNGVDMSVKVFHQEPFGEYEERNCETTYTFGAYQEYCEQTGKEKELIQITKQVSKESFFSVHCEDLEGGDYDPEIIPTGFSTKLGIDWQLWMLLREIFSNMVDEGGSYCEEEFKKPKYGTIFKLKFDEDSEFAEIWNNRHLYINEEAPRFVISNSIDVLNNEEEYLRIYKQNILVYKDEKIPSRYAYNIKFGDIDEKRILSDLYSVEGEIASAILRTDNEEFLREIITSNFVAKDKEFLASRSPYQSPSELIHDIAFEIYQEYDEVKSYGWIIDGIKKLQNCKIGGKKIRSVGDHIWNYADTVTVESVPVEVFTIPGIDIEPSQTFEETYSLKDDIQYHYNFTLDVEVQKAKLKGDKAIADKFKNCIIIDEDFNVEKDFHKFLVQYIDLTQKGNILENLSKFATTLLRK